MRAGAALALALVAAKVATAAAGTPSLLGAGGRLLVGAVDAPLERAVAAVLDELELKTLVSVVRGQAGGLSLRATTASGGFGGQQLQDDASPELCCFDAGVPALELKQRVATELLRALGVTPAALAAGPRGISITSAGVITAAEAEAIDALAAPLVLPAPSALPAKLNVGLWQLIPSDIGHDPTAADVADLLDGRGRRLIEGAMQLAKRLGAAGAGRVALPGLVAALPSFVFRGNKAEVVLLGPESAELRPGGGGQGAFSGLRASDVRGLGLGAGVARATKAARELVPGFAGAVPAHLGDGSVLLLRAAAARAERMQAPGQDVEGILKDHRSAVAWARASSWAQGRGALLGVPTYLPLDRVLPVTYGEIAAKAQLALYGNGKQAPVADDDAASAEGGAAAPDETVLEVLVLRDPKKPEAPATGTAVDKGDALKDAEESSSWSLGNGLLILWTSLGCCFVAWRFKQQQRRGGADFISKAERDLERLVNSL